MAIKRIKVSNFKSFKELDLRLGNFNVVVGANASGKSNFIQVFKFIRDISRHGLDNAISLQGSEYLTNIGIGFPKTLSLQVVSDPGFGFGLTGSVLADVREATYEFMLRFKHTTTAFELMKDRLTLEVAYRRWQRGGGKPPKKGEGLGSGAITIRNDNGTPRYSLKGARKLGIKASDVFPRLLREKVPAKSLLLSSPVFFFPPVQWAFGNVAIYDFDPKLSKQAVPVAGKIELEENGSNLSLVLKSIVENDNKKRKFSNLIKDLLPFVDDLATDKFADKSLLFKLRENYFPDVYFPGSFISDGTVNVGALLIALYFEQKALSIIEEPERNVHPHLISGLLGMMKDASRNKQIIVTTHSPEVVKHAGLENLLFVSRDKEGYSSICRPREKQQVKVFLENELGLDELFIDNLLGD